jgi:nitrogen fixation/metabolism regulation signal transduction histidine kinase
MNAIDGALGASAESADRHQADARPFRRRRWLIDPLFQGQCFLAMVIVSTLVGLAAAIGVAWVFYSTAGSGPAEAETWEAFGSSLVVKISLVALVTLGLAGVFLSHRIAGPAYHLRKAARRVGDGDLDCRVHLRRHDYLQSTAESFNQMIAQLNERRAQQRQREIEARQAIVRALEKLRSSEPSALSDVRILLEEAKTHLS